MKPEKATAKRQANTAHFQSEMDAISSKLVQPSKSKRFSVRTVNGKFCLENSNGELVDKFGQPVETVSEVFFYYNEYRASMAANWLNERP
jgi:hypothetical protein